MIAFEITETPDPNVKTQFRFHKNDIYLGRKSGDLLIDDPGVFNSHLLIEIQENELLVHPQKGVESFLLNGKRATTIRKIKVGDTLGLGSTTVKILEYVLTPDRSKKTVLNQKLNQMIDTNSASLAAVEKLSLMMK